MCGSKTAGEVSDTGRDGRKLMECCHRGWTGQLCSRLKTIVCYPFINIVPNVEKKKNYLLLADDCRAVTNF